MSKCRARQFARRPRPNGVIELYIGQHSEITPNLEYYAWLRLNRLDDCNKKPDRWEKFQREKFYSFRGTKKPFRKNISQRNFNRNEDAAFF